MSTPGSFDGLEADRVVRFVQFCMVGGVGALLDLTLSFALLANGTHYLLANTAGFLLAVSSNFVGNWAWTYERPDGRIGWQYASYVLLHSLTFLGRAAVVVVLVEAAGAPATIATLIGVGAAATLNFLGVERVLGGSGELWFDAVDAMNHLAHVVYSSRIRRWLLATGLYDIAFRAYANVLNLLYRDRQREIDVNGARGWVLTSQPTETVSVLHTLENERPILEVFVDELQEDDVVLDVGANVGIFSVVAGDVVDEVVAIEPHGPTARRCQANFGLNNVHGYVRPIALGNRAGRVSLAVQNDSVGTQRPAVDPEGDLDVRQARGDDLLVEPTVVKIDVEGAELDVLQGLADTLRESVRFVFVECHGTVREVRTHLMLLGFDVDELECGGQVYLCARG